MAENEFSYTMVSLKSHGFFWVTFTGEVGMGRLARAHEAFTSHPDYVAGVDELLDFSHTSIKQMTKKEIEMIRQFMAERPDRHNCMSVIVVNSRLEYGLGRMMGGSIDQDVPAERHMAYSLREALDWLRPGQVDELLAMHQQALERGGAA